MCWVTENHISWKTNPFFGYRSSEDVAVVETEHHCTTILPSSLLADSQIPLTHPTTQWCEGRTERGGTILRSLNLIGEVRRYRKRVSSHHWRKSRAHILWRHHNLSRTYSFRSLPPWWLCHSFYCTMQMTEPVLQTIALFIHVVHFPCIYQ
jgi:hypothetical protein